MNYLPPLHRSPLMSKTKAGVLVVTPRSHSASNSIALCRAKKSLFGLDTEELLVLNPSKSLSQNAKLLRLQAFGSKLIMFDNLFAHV